MLLANGIWISTGKPPRREGQPALFIDRDGVLIEERDYLSDPALVALEQGAADIIRWARQHELAVVVVTNQSGIGRGLFSWRDYEAVEAAIERQLKAEDAGVDLVIACPFHEGAPSFDAEQARWRKPGSAMIEHAALMMGLDLSASWLIGDKASDIEAARRAGLAGGLHVLTGHGRDVDERDRALALASNEFRVLTARALPEALDCLKSQAFPDRDR